MDYIDISKSITPPVTEATSLFISNINRWNLCHRNIRRIFFDNLNLPPIY